MNKLVEHADSLADRTTMRPEDGVRELKIPKMVAMRC